MNTQIFKLLKTLLAFVAISFFVYSVLIWLWGTYIPEKYANNLNFKVGDSYTRFQEVKKYNNIDILFAGSSHAYRGFDPRIFEKAGYSTFNLGSTAQTPFHTKYILKHYIDELHPKWLIMEVYPKVFTIDGVESSLDIISNNEDMNTLNFVLHHKNFRVLNTYIYSQIHNIFNIIPKDSILKSSSYNTYIGKGYVERKMSFNKNRIYKRNELVYLDSHFNSLEEIDKICKKRGVLPIYVVAPIDKKRYNSFVNLDEFDEKMKKFEIFYDFNILMKMNDTLHFYDSHHLNQNGVELFNQELIKILTSLKK